MKRVLYFFLFLISGFNTLAQDVFAQNNLTAWCIVPFDKVNRGPEERILMLEKLGFKQYVYDWRAEHIASFEKEIKLAKKHHITMEGVWLWIEKGKDETGQLSADNLKVINIAAENKLASTFWVGFANNFFEGLSHHEKVEKGATFLKYLHSVLTPKKLKIALYNHGDWFGEPENEIEIIKQSGLKDVGIVYSFHHGHQQINRFPSMLKTMLPYLVAINLNGMDLKKGQILSVGADKSEKEMIQMIQESGYKGRIGIIGHRTDEDVAVVLQENVAGLKSLLKSN